MSGDTRETILLAARRIVQSHGYNGLSFRDLAQQVGIKSASVHYHFPTKGDLGAALARAYTEAARADLERVLERPGGAVAHLQGYVALFRKALEDGNRLCLCAILAAEADDLPPEVAAEVRTFAEVNVAWLIRALGQGQADRAEAVFAAVTGAQLAARGRADAAVFDRIVASYRKIGLLP